MTNTTETTQEKQDPEIEKVIEELKDKQQKKTTELKESEKVIHLQPTDAPKLPSINVLVPANTIQEERGKLVSAQLEGLMKFRKDFEELVNQFDSGGECYGDWTSQMEADLAVLIGKLFNLEQALGITKRTQPISDAYLDVIGMMEELAEYRSDDYFDCFLNSSILTALDTATNLRKHLL